MKFLIILLLLGACAPKEQTGTGPGFGGKMEVSVLVDGDKIKQIKVLNHNESAYVGGKAFALLEKRIIERQSPEVDNISGASFTSFAYKMAVAEALGKAKFGEYKITVNTKDPLQSAITNGTNIMVDVLVIGGGGAGLTAAITATENGSDVVLIEKMSLLGGNTLYATGGLNAAGTIPQKAQNIDDTPQIFYDDTMKGGQNKNDPQLVKILSEEGSNTIDWLASKGIDLSKMSILGGSSKKRAHQPEGGYAVGPYLTDGLITEANKLGIDIRTDTKAINFDIQNNQINSVVVEDKNTRYSIVAKAVVIATGGFGANLDMIVSYNPKLKGFKTSNQKGATGDIFPIANKLGIQLKDMEYIQIHPTGEATRSLLITEAVRGSGGIMVNQEGQRFINELGTRDVVSAAILAQNPAKAYLIYDEQVRNNLGAVKSYEKLGLVKSGKTIAELAKAIKADPTVLQDTITKYNESVASQTDPLGRAIFGKTLTEASYYAIAVLPVIHHTMGGIAVNTNSQVLLKNNTPIKGLYAAGEVVGGIHGANRLGGNAVADITIFGRRSGERAAKFAQEN